MNSAVATRTGFLGVQIRRLSTITSQAGQITRQLRVQAQPAAQNQARHLRDCRRHLASIPTPQPTISSPFPNMANEEDFILTLSCPEYVLVYLSFLNFDVGEIYESFSLRSLEELP